MNSRALLMNAKVEEFFVMFLDCIDRCDKISPLNEGQIVNT